MANDAIDLVKHFEPNIVFLDLNLAGYPGTIVIRTIRDYKPLKDTKIVIVTGHPEILEYHSDISRVDLILIKPVTNQKLLETIEVFAN